MHTSYAKQAMHVPVSLPPEKVNRQHHTMVWSYQINQGKVLVTIASDAHSRNNISVVKLLLAIDITVESIICYLCS